MRHISLFAVLFLFIAAPALTQEWVEFESVEDGFGVTFPAQPTVEQSTFKSQFGADLPARVYTAESGQSRFSLRVVDYANIETILAAKAKSCPAGAETCRGGGSSTGPGYSWADRAGAVIYVTWQYLQRDAKVTYLGWNNIDLVEGQILSLVNNGDKSLTQVGIYMHENKLYILEGTVPAGYPEPGFFHQSIHWLDANGNGVRYQTLYHNGFPKPPVGRGGQGQGGAGRGGGNAGPDAQAQPR